MNTLLPNIQRKFLVDVLKAHNGGAWLANPEVVSMIDALTAAGLYGDATGDEFDAHDALTDKLMLLDDLARRTGAGASYLKDKIIFKVIS